MTSLQENKTARISTLCALYFAQGLPWGFMTTALITYLLAKENLNDFKGVLARPGRFELPTP